MIWTVSVFGEKICNSAYSVRAKLFSIETESQVKFFKYLKCALSFLMYSFLCRRKIMVLERYRKWSNINREIIQVKENPGTPFKIFLFKFLCFLSVIIANSDRTANPWLYEEIQASSVFNSLYWQKGTVSWDRFQRFWQKFTELHCKEKNYENLKQIFSEKEYRGLSPNFHIHVSVSELYVPTMEPPFLLEEICGTILGIYKSLTDTWMLKLGLGPRNSQKRNI